MSFGRQLAARNRCARLILRKLQSGLDCIRHRARKLHCSAIQTLLPVVAEVYIVSNDTTTMLFSWFKRRRRSKLRAQAFPTAWEALLNQNVLHYRDLNP